MIKAKKITQDDYSLIFSRYDLYSQCSCPFVLPFWLKTWYSIFGEQFTPCILTIEENENLLGIAPLMQKNDTALFMGNESVCDFQDMVIAEHGAPTFFYALLKELKRLDIQKLELGALMPDSRTCKLLPAVCENLGIQCRVEPAGSVSVIDLPASWESYLDGLAGKQRHEIRRKMRRLTEQGEVEFKYGDGGADRDREVTSFLKHFAESRADKAEFLSEEMMLYFETLAVELQMNKMLKLGCLIVNQQRVATTFGFVFKNSYFLYNNGFSPNYSSLSVGLLSKVQTIQRAIETSVNTFNLLKGDENYKKHLGGQSTALKRLIITL